MHSLVSPDWTDKAVHSVLSVRRSARQPRELWFLAVRYCRRRRITHGPGFRRRSGVSRNSVFAWKGRQCYNIHLSVTGYLSRKLCVSGRALIARGLTRCFSCVLLCCATVQRGRPQPFNRYSHPASPPRDTTPVFSFHNCYLSMTTFMVVARSSVARASRL